MFWTIVKRELVSHLQSLRFSASFILCFVMMTASIHLLAEKQAQPAKQVVADSGIRLHEWNSSTLESLSRWGPVLYRREPTLGVLCIGLGNRMSISANASAYDQPQHSPQLPFLHNPAALLFPAFDYCLIVGIVVSLIAIVFTYDLIAGDRENGTLKLTLANSVPRHSILYAKWLGSFLSFLAGYLPGLLLIMLYMALHPSIALRTEDYVSILTIDLLSVLYAACFFSLGLLVSCWCRDSRTSLLTLLMLWTVLTLIIPGVSAYLGATLRPTSPSYEISMQVQAIKRETNLKTIEKLRTYVDQLNPTASLENDELDELFEAYQNLVFREEIQSSYRDISSIRHPYTQKLSRQIELSKSISCLSPFSSFVYLTSDLCHTGLASNSHFRRLVDKYQGKFIGYIDERLNTDKLRDPPNLDSLPAFDYYEPDISEIIHVNTFHLWLLLLYSVLFLLVTHLLFLKYDVR